jgi:hypothetical protein
MEPCEECDGDGTETCLGGTPEDYDASEEGPPDMSDLVAETVECRNCDGRSTVYPGLGCPRCGADQDTLSSSLMPGGYHKQSCSNCSWSSLVG